MSYLRRWFCGLDADGLVIEILILYLAKSRVLPPSPPGPLSRQQALGRKKVGGFLNSEYLLNAKIAYRLLASHIVNSSRKIFELCRMSVGSRFG
jgi:hypothetical protein